MPKNTGSVNFYEDKMVIVTDSVILEYRAKEHMTIATFIDQIHPDEEVKNYIYFYNKVTKQKPSETYNIRDGVKMHLVMFDVPNTMDDKSKAISCLLNLCGIKPNEMNDDAKKRLSEIIMKH